MILRNALSARESWMTRLWLMDGRLLEVSKDVGRKVGSSPLCGRSLAVAISQLAKL